MNSCSLFLELLDTFWYSTNSFQPSKPWQHGSSNLTSGPPVQYPQPTQYGLPAAHCNFQQPVPGPLAPNSAPIPLSHVQQPYPLAYPTTQASPSTSHFNAQSTNAVQAGFFAAGLAQLGLSNDEFARR